MPFDSSGHYKNPLDPDSLLRSAEDPIGFLKEVSTNMGGIRCETERQLDEWVQNGWVTKEQGSELIRNHQPRKGRVNRIVSDDFWHAVKWYLDYQDRFPPLEN